MATRQNQGAIQPCPRFVYTIGDWEVDPARGCLKKGGQECPLRQKAFHVLFYLLEHRDRLVTKGELMEHVWKGTAVTDDVLVQCVLEIRKALGDDFQNPRFIKTIPRVGYRFIRPVEVHQSAGVLTARLREATSIEIEYEEDELRAPATIAANTGEAPALPAAPGPRHWLVPAASVVLVAAVALVLAERRGYWPFARKFPETTVALVPGKKPVVVISFENQSGNPDQDWMRDGLADMFITELSRSPKLSVLSRQQLHVLLDRVGHKPQNAVGLAEALEVAQKSRADVFLLGSYASFGDKLRIGVQIHDGRTGQVLKDESAVADHPEQLLAQIDLVSLKLASDLGVAPADQSKKTSLAQLMTDNLEAYRDYSLALEEAETYHNARAVALWEKAVALDPKFAMAHARIGYAYAVTWGNQEEKGKLYLQKAFRLSDHLTEKDRLYITTWYAIANHDYLGAIRNCRVLIAQYPEEVEAYLTLGYLLRGEEQFQQAVTVLQQGLLIDPESRDLYNALGFAYNGSNYDAAIAAHQHYVALGPAEPNAHDSLALSYQFAGRFAEAHAEFNRALELNPEFHLASLHLADLDRQLGRYQKAIEGYRRYLRIAPSDRDRYVGYSRLFEVYLRKGKLDMAQEAAREEMKIEPDFVGHALLLALKRNDLSAAEKLQQRFFRDFEKSPYGSRGARPSNRVLWYFHGCYALETGRTAEAIEDFKEEQRHGAWVSVTDDNPEDALARAYVAGGQFDQAIAEYERILRLYPNYAMAHFYLGQACDRKGQTDRALSEYRRFLQVWKDADPDIPEVSVAKKRLAS